MRVISGSAGSIPLKTPAGKDTRPTTDRIKETLFNLLPHDLSGVSFLDLFAGSGGIGIEALSRGAEHCVFVDKSRRATNTISENLRLTHLEDRAQILTCDAETALKRLEEKDVFDLVFMDPPYNHELEKQVLTILSTSDLIDDDSTVVVEASLDTTFDYLDTLGFSIKRQKIYKTNQHLFLAKKNHQK